MRYPSIKIALPILAAFGAVVAPLAAAAAPNPAKPHKLGNVATARDLSAAPLEGARVYILPIRDAIMRDLAFTFHRQIEKAVLDKADAVILDFDTPGGELQSMTNMLGEILDLECPVFSFVNAQAISAGALLALGGDVIVMTVPSSIGDAYPITGGGQQVGGGSERVEEKILSYMRAELRKTAKARGHDPDLAQRMTDPAHEYGGLASLKADQLLTLDYDEATSIGLAAYLADDFTDLLEKAGYKNPIIIETELTWSEELAGFLVNPAVSGLLMLVALAAFYMEFKTPGVGVPAAVGLVAIGLFFWGGMLADLASYWELALFLLGLVLLAAEVFVIPGFGVAGVLGLGCIFSSLIFSMANLPVKGFDPINLDSSVFKPPLYAMAGAMVGAVPVFWAITRFLPSVPMFRGLVSDPDRTETAKVEDEIRNAPSRLVGRSGEALSDLRPSGIAMIEGERIDVVTRGDFIYKGSKIKVVAEEGNEVVVVLLAPPTQTPPSA
jgi:membrane-bound serine protease (ClpP class)